MYGLCFRGHIQNNSCALVHMGCSRCMSHLMYAEGMRGLYLTRSNHVADSLSAHAT